MIESGIRAVFFDAVGTLLFPHAPVSRTYAECAGRHGVTVDQDRVRIAFREAFARQEHVDREAGWRTDEERERRRWRTIVADVLPDTPDVYFDDLWNWFRTPAAWTVHPDAGGVLRELTARGLVCGIGSNFDSRLLGLVDALPELAAVRGRCVVSSLVGWRKPSTEFFAAVVRAAGCAAPEVLYVGDDPANDFDGATAAGLRAVLLDPSAEHSGPERIRQLRELVAG